MANLISEVQALSDVLSALSKLSSDDDKLWVLQTAGSKLGMQGAAANVSLATAAPASNTSTGSASVGSGLTPKEFIRLKAPNSDVQRVACLAYFLTYERDQTSFKSRDLSALNTEAAGPKFNVTRAVDNAGRRNGILAEAGKSQKQITVYGEDLVNALPDQAAVAALPPPRKKAAAKRSPAKNAKATKAKTS